MTVVVKVAALRWVILRVLGWELQEGLTVVVKVAALHWVVPRVPGWELVGLTVMVTLLVVVLHWLEVIEG